MEAWICQNYLDPGNGLPTQIYDPAFYAPEFLFRVISRAMLFLRVQQTLTPDGSCVSPAGLAVLRNFFPMPNLPGTDYGYYNNYLVNSPLCLWNGLTRTSGRLRSSLFPSKDRLAGRVSLNGSFNSLTPRSVYGSRLLVTWCRRARIIGDNEDSRSQELSSGQKHTRFVNNISE